MNMTEANHPIEPIRRSVSVGCDAAEAFRIFTADFGSWWPLATHSIGQADAEVCFFESKDGGKIYEIGRDGVVHPWGVVTAWDPPNRVVFSWHPGRGDETAQEVELRFIPTDDGARVELEHRGWETLGTKAEATRDGYETGWVPVLDRYASACG
jgi:uncharacterized protein YndB with AHSA1/START domain